MCQSGGVINHLNGGSVHPIAYVPPASSRAVDAVEELGLAFELVEMSG